MSYFGETQTSNCGNCDVCNPLKISEPTKTFQTTFTTPNKSKATGNYSSEIFENLRKLRRQIADTEKLPAYIVFSDATLKDMAEKLPSTRQQMLDVSGVGQIKLEKYGKRFLDLLLQLSMK